MSSFTFDLSCSSVISMNKDLIGEESQHVTLRHSVYHADRDEFSKRQVYFKD